MTFSESCDPSAAEVEFDSKSAWLLLCHHARARRVLYRVSPPRFSKLQTFGLTKRANPLLQKFSNWVSPRRPGAVVEAEGEARAFWLQPDASALGIGLPHELSFDGFCGLEEEKSLETVALEIRGQSDGETPQARCSPGSRFLGLAAWLFCTGHWG